MSRSINQILEKLRNEPLVRTFALDRDAVNAKERTVNLAFASDKPIDHWFGRLELSMKSGHMRTDRLIAAPLMMGHDIGNWRSQVGVIDSYSVGKDGIARANARFSKSPDGELVMQDVDDGIRQQVSVGFNVYEMEKVGRTADGVDLFRSEDWGPYEISIVPVALDISVGVGRGKINQLENQMSVTELEETRSLAAEIVDFASIFNEQELARNLMLANPSTTLDEVRHAIVAKRKRENPPAIVPPMDPHDQAAREGAPRVELARSIPRYGTVRSFTGSDTERAEKAFRFGQWISGVVVGNGTARRWCADHGLITRAMNEAVNEKGGYLVPDEFGNDLIYLVEKYGVFRRNAKIVPMKSDARSDPRVTSDLTAEFVGESTTGTDQDPAFDRIELVAKKIRITVPYSSELDEDSSIVVGDQLADFAARAFAKKEDLCGFLGDATSTYGGMVGVCEKLKGLDTTTIANIAGLKVGTGNAYSELTLADFRGVVSLLPQYADTDAAAWFVSRSFYWNTMVGAMLAAGGVTAAEVEDQRNQRFLGYRVEFSQVMPKTEANSQVCAILGDLYMGASLGDRRSIRISISDQVRFKEDDLVFKATERFDINVHDVGNASATAALREPGPLVGLITAAT